ncbi:MAG: winged helix-turn-helix domain-containing protein [Candidatus Methanoperedens sp.]|nr:winged helix-turn-helix domain-containing protein [Candidatus Methanoperedens sp.]
MPQCKCASKDSQLCCPADSELRKNWLDVLEKEHMPLRQKSKDIANNLKLLSNPKRVEILLMLKTREHCLDEISRKMKLRKSAISYHLSFLNRQGMICKNRRSRFSFYSLTQKGMGTISLFQ